MSELQPRAACRNQAMTGLTAVAAVVAALAMLGGCAAVGPDYEAPKPAVDASFLNVGAGSNTAEPTAADIASFWRGFQDPTLNALVERALQVNGDVRIAQARLQEARASRREADSLGLPTVGVDAQAARAVTPWYEAPTLSRSDRTGTAYDASFVANWELDLFGRARRGRESAQAQLGASEASLAGAQTSVAAEVASNYLALRGLQQRFVVAESSLGTQRQSLDLTGARLDAGRGTQLDVARARTLVENTEATLPALQAAIDQTIFRLATLSAQPPRALRESLAVAAPLPGLPVTDLAALPIGTPEQWLARRPDIAAAERQLAASTANIGIARAELYPRISLSGLLGLAAGRFGDLGESDAARYSVGAGLSWTLLDFGAIRARIAASEARALQSLAQYELTLATALEETEGALTQFTRNTQRAARLAQAARSAQEAADLARLRFDAGVTDFLTVLDADREVLTARDASEQARSDTATSLVAVYRTLGGGWTPPAAPTAAAPGAARVATATAGNAAPAAR